MVCKPFISRVIESSLNEAYITFTYMEKEVCIDHHKKQIENWHTA